ncbi:lysophospholipase [Aliiroseovarius halocynthiae]|uniref:Alpha/beta hydrolase n=1 Tax=Aliiroseovarius halocynthiae TaxID=985055 RepID=A0A545SVN5_9RHOB|nr:alpha/beta hydrolase [Aliiroseovarius halocynthiae]TQV69019.1 alpha/beta hydrolase [Aliiroseovarius halocynthiae]SMR71769.1 lysophospholipase [Aliiroseovarius halocynthiae]
MHHSDAPLFDDIAQGPAHGRAFWRKTSDGVRIRLAMWPAAEDSAPAGTILLFPGRTEYIEKYGLVAAELVDRGYTTLSIDWRGQGLSDRADKDRLLGHVGHFSEYQLDVAAMMALADELDLPRPFILLGHSMGGCIGLRSLHEGLDVKGACFSAPMWGITIASALRPVAWGISWALHNTPWKLMLTPGTARKTYVDIQPFDDNMLTTDPEMYALMQLQASARPELTLGGPTAGWLYAALRETSDLMKQPAPNVQTVTFLGTQERIVEPGPIHDLMRRWHNGRLQLMPGCEHEVLMEAEPIRSQVYDALDVLTQDSENQDVA